MAKRKQPEPSPDAVSSPSKRRRKTADPLLSNGLHDDDSEPVVVVNGTPKKVETPSKRKKKSAAYALLEEEENEEGSPTPRANGQKLFSTPRKKASSVNDTPSKSAKADRSAKRKSARALAETQDEDDWDGQTALAREILGDDELEGNDVEPSVEATAEDNADATTPVKAPGKRGRPKGAKNKRSPTPEGDIPPEERYFFQNRSGPPQISSNKFNSVKLFAPDEYFEQMQSYQDHHEAERAQLMKLHARSYPQWRFELAEGVGLCLYGYGSKRHLVSDFAEWIYNKSNTPPRIVVVNGYTSKLNIRGILNTVASAIVEEDEHLRLIGQPQEMLDTLLSHLTNQPPPGQLMVMINSIDAHPLRRSSTQSVLARLAAHPRVHFIATADLPTFPVLWNSTLLDQFRFVFHDCTTFAPYTTEINVVDEVHELLGRKRVRAGGKEGIGFVLKSLPENARNLYRLLLSEILSILTDGIDAPTSMNMNHHDDYEDEDEQDTQSERRRNKTKKSARARAREAAANPNNASAEEVGIEHRVLYQKASTDFICSSSMNFQFLLKEFHDHQLITSRRDAGGVELLGVPLGRDEIEAVLEDLAL